MKTIPRQLLDDLSDDLDALSGAGGQMVLNFLANAEWGDISELRVLATEAMEGICSSLGDVSTARTAQFYDDVREASVGSALGKVPDTVRSPDATAGAVRALIQTVVDTGETDVFGGRLAERVDYEVKRASGECVRSLAKADPLKPRYARVPAGGETCRFCIMLASRGFVYASEETAGKDGHYHAHCRCKIVPGFKGATVKGYDPDKLYRQWMSGNPDTGSLVGYLRIASDSGDVKYSKPMEAFVGTTDERDLFAHVALHRVGYKFEVLPEDAPDGFSNIDLMVDGKNTR